MQSGSENGTFESRCKLETFEPVNAYLFSSCLSSRQQALAD